MIKRRIQKKLDAVQDKMNYSIKKLKDSNDAKEVEWAFIYINGALNDFEKINQKYKLGLSSEFQYTPDGSDTSYNLNDGDEIKKLEDFLIRKMSNAVTEEVFSDTFESEEDSKSLIEPELRKNLKKQDEQFEEMQKAQVFIKEKEYDEAINILERIMYKEGLVVNGVTWPMLLADAYYKAGRNDDCWKYLNFLSTNFPESGKKIVDLRMKISKKEKRWNDALYNACLILIDNFVEPSQAMIDKKIDPILKNIKLEIKVDILNLIKFGRETAINDQSNIQEIRRVFKKIVDK